MRKYAILKKPIGEIKKLMIYDTGSEAYMFLYDSVCEDGKSCSDMWYENIDDAIEASTEYDVSDDEWIIINDPLPHCQHDIISPIRVKGRCIGKPQWGTYEKLINGTWVKFI